MENFIKKFTFYKLVDKVPTPCPMIDIAFLEFKENIVCQSKINDDIKVSTVFINHNMNMFGDKPLFFETMVFGGKFDHYRLRASTWEEAEENHTKTCTMIIDDL